MGRIQRGLLLEYAGSAWMTVEVIGSMWAGLVAGSFALLAFGGDSLIELASGIAVALHLREDFGGSNVLGHRTAMATSICSSRSSLSSDWEQVTPTSQVSDPTHRRSESWWLPGLCSSCRTSG
ncbi:MAG: hypothetical protein LYZ69_06345 [Nitrososphaerales archaeon]|nr:hypothetical protein [Nitrososphaerales archaeon]